MGYIYESNVNPKLKTEKRATLSQDRASIFDSTMMMHHSVHVGYGAMFLFMSGSPVNLYCPLSWMCKHVHG